MVPCAVIEPRQSGRAHMAASGEKHMRGLRAALVVPFASIPVTSMASDYPAPREGDWVAKSFKFHTGETMPELRLHYTTIGEASGQPVLVLHGSGGSAVNMLTPTFAGELFGKG